MVRCPFSLSRLVKVTDTGQVVYKAEKQACQAFPDPYADDLKAGAYRNFQVLSPLDFLAEFTQHIPPKGSHLIRYYGWYSNKSRGMRKKAEADKSNEPLAEEAAASRSSQTWAMLIKRVYEVDPLSCPQCGGQMKVVAFIEPPHKARWSRRSCVTAVCGRHSQRGHHPRWRTWSSTWMLLTRTAPQRKPANSRNSLTSTSTPSWPPFNFPRRESGRGTLRSSSGFETRILR